MLKRIVEIIALFLIGEGLVGLIKPKTYSRFWKTGPKPPQKLAKTLTKNPAEARLLYAIELSLGVWLALREPSKDSGV